MNRVNRSALCGANPEGRRVTGLARFCFPGSIRVPACGFGATPNTVFRRDAGKLHARAPVVFGMKGA